MAQSAVYTDNSNGTYGRKVQFIQIILTGHMAQSAVYTDNSNGDIWHKVQFIHIILKGTYGTKCSL